MLVVNTTDIGRPYNVIGLVYNKNRHNTGVDAINEMIESATALNADAIVNVRILHSTHSVISHYYHAYGTAVKFN